MELPSTASVVSKSTSKSGCWKLLAGICVSVYCEMFKSCSVGIAINVAVCNDALANATPEAINRHMRHGKGCDSQHTQKSALQVIPCVSSEDLCHRCFPDSPQNSVHVSNWSQWRSGHDFCQIVLHPEFIEFCPYSYRNDFTIWGPQFLLHP